MVETETVTDQKRLERAHAEAVKFCVDHGDFDIAIALGRCTVTRIELETSYEIGIGGMEVFLTVPPEHRGLIESSLDEGVDDQGEWNGPGAITWAFSSVTGLGDTIRVWPNIHLAAPPSEVPRQQGTARHPGRFDYRGATYRSRTEIEVAKALDDANVLYFPLPLGIRHYVRLAEPDFLIIHFGRVGVLEIDGPHHTPLTRAKESAKDAKLYQSGVHFIHHVSVTEVDRDPKAVVSQFLTMLRGPMY